MKMRKFLFAIAVIMLLAGCSKWRNEEPQFTFNIQAMNLEGAKAMAHLQSGAGTKASVGFEQEDALYLVYDNNEIRLPKISFTIEFPDSYSEKDKKELKEYTHVCLREPIVKDLGKYIYVYSALTYEVDLPGILDGNPLGECAPGGEFRIPHCNTLVRKSDGLCLTVDDNIGGLLYEDGSLIEDDSQGRCYIAAYSGYSGRVQVGRLIDEDGGVQIKMVDVVGKTGMVSMLPRMLVSDDIAYVACHSWRREGNLEGGIALVALSPDFTCQRTYLERETVIGLEKYGNCVYLFGCEEGILSGAEEDTFKVYNVTSGCDLVASRTFAPGARTSIQHLSKDNPTYPCEVISEKNGVFTCYLLGNIVQFDAKSGECTIPELNEVIRGYVSDSVVYFYPEGDLYLVHHNKEGKYVELLKIDITTASVEQLKRIAVSQEGHCNCKLTLADERTGTLRVEVEIVRTEDGAIIEKVREDVVEPEIAEAFADAEAKEHYGIDFGTYKVVNVVPLTDDLDSSEN